MLLINPYNFTYFSKQQQRTKQRKSKNNGPQVEQNQLCSGLNLIFLETAEQRLETNRDCYLECIIFWLQVLLTVVFG